MLIKQIARTTRLEEEELRRLADNASRNYKIYEIPKRTGGTRVIAHPSRELKAIQRWITRIVISRLPVHDTATAYKKGSGIRENAERHRTTRFTNRYDFKNFFPSFRIEQVEAFLRFEAVKVGIILETDDIEFLGSILCRFGRLTIGAPSSPAITNAMMFSFDQKMFEHCTAKGLIYTRYADDIFVSAHEPDKLVNIETRIAEAKRNISHLKLRLNRQKTAHLSKKFKRSITGVIITPDHRLSIGRERKREIKALVHRWINGKLKGHEVHYMRGLVAFARDIEPSFEKSLQVKYGVAPINEILRNPELDIKHDQEFGNLDWF
jgi:retron-type reverse transcriptase